MPSLPSNKRHHR